MFTVRLFGPPVIEGKDEPLNGRAAQRRRLALLALLSASPGHQLSRDKLLAYVWARQRYGAGASPTQRLGARPAQRAE